MSLDELPVQIRTDRRHRGEGCFRDGILQLQSAWELYLTLSLPRLITFQISLAASPEILHNTVWRTWLFIAYSVERWLNYQFLQKITYTFLLKRLGECTFFNLTVLCQRWNYRFFPSFFWVVTTPENVITSPQNVMTQNVTTFATKFNNQVTQNAIHFRHEMPRTVTQNVITKWAPSKVITPRICVFRLTVAFLSLQAVLGHIMSHADASTPAGQAKWQRTCAGGDVTDPMSNAAFWDISSFVLLFFMLRIMLKWKTGHRKARLFH